MTSRATSAVILPLALLLLLDALWLWSTRQVAGYRVLAHSPGFNVSSFKLSRGRDHDMWDTDPWRITFGRWLASTKFTRSIRLKLLGPVSWFRTRTKEPSLAFIVRLKGEMSDADLAGLSAHLVSGTNTYYLDAQASERNFAQSSLIKCWRMESTPPTNAPLELQISFASGAQVARIAIPTDKPEFTRPLVPPSKRKQDVAGILQSFLLGARSADALLKTLHEFYEEYGAPDYLTAFEMLYYDRDGAAAGESPESLDSRLQEAAHHWLRWNESKVPTI